MRMNRCILPALLAAAVSACGETPAPQAQGHEKIILVAATRVPCQGVAPMQCLQVRERADQPWQLVYSGIEGFEFHPGTEYRLRISEIPVDNPPADGSSIRWVLRDVLEEHRIGNGLNQAP